jgi:hypothetical protein
MVDIKDIRPSTDEPIFNIEVDSITPKTDYYESSRKTIIKGK